MASSESNEAYNAAVAKMKKALRLNYTHFLLRQISGYLLHPSISADRRNLHIADLGTGTAIWPLSLLPELPPSTHISAFDISPTLFPPASFLPQTLTLHMHDIFTPLPSSEIGKYDIVNIRCMYRELDTSDKSPKHLINTALLMLKLEGYIQWLEPLPSSARVVGPDPPIDTPACEVLALRLRTSPNEEISYDWILNLPQLFKSRGVQVLAADRIPIPKALRGVWNAGLLAELEEVGVGGRAGKAGGMGMEGRDGKEEEEARREFLVKLAGEFERGGSVDLGWGCVVGKKG